MTLGELKLLHTESVKLMEDEREDEKEIAVCRAQAWYSRYSRCFAVHGSNLGSLVRFKHCHRHEQLRLMPDRVCNDQRRHVTSLDLSLVWAWTRSLRCLGVLFTP